MKTVLVTGGTGFIGSHVVALLQQRGYDVRSLSKRDGDFREPEFCKRAVKNCDTVIHLAWSSSPYSSNLDPTADISINVQGSVSLFQACAEAGVQKIIFSSSGGTVYGEPEMTPIPETHPIRPLSSYGITKAMVERYLYFFYRNSRLNYVILRGANAYGPGQNFSKEQGVIGHWLSCLLKGDGISVYGDGSQIRDFLYISDFVEAIVRACEWEGTASTMNVGSGTGHSLTEIVDALQSITKLDPKTEFIPRRQFDVPRNILDCTRAGSELNWKPQVGLEEGIRKTWAWMQAQETSDR